MNEKERIEKFIAIVADIRNARFFQETKEISMNVGIEIGKPVEQNIGNFDEVSLRSLIMDLRLLTLEQDGVEVRKICDLLIKNTKNSETKSNVEGWEKIYSNFLDGLPVIPLNVDGKVDTNWQVLEKWIYANYSHRDKRHIDNLNNLGFGQPTHRFNFLSAVFEFRRIVASVATNAQLVLVEMSDIH